VQEIDDFLDCPRTELEQCPLDWWKDNNQYYPYLSCIALEILTIPVSSVASERTVSSLNRIVTNKRGRLSMENVNKLVVLISMPIDFWRGYVGDPFVYHKERRE
jgi:hAT family C-terminal dimerisation region